MKTLYHGSRSELNMITNEGVFAGIFASAYEEVALSHANILHEIKVEKVLSTYELNYEIDYNLIKTFLLEYCEEEQIDRLHEIVIEEDQIDEDDFELLKSSNFAEASFYSQRLRIMLATSLNYDCIEMSDEHGTSYGVCPGSKINCIKH